MKKISADVQSIMKVHSFLENWGIINFNIDTNTKMINPLAKNLFTTNKSNSIKPTQQLIKSKDYNKLIENKTFYIEEKGNIISCSKSLYYINIDKFENIHFKASDDFIVISEKNGREVRTVYPSFKSTDCYFNNLLSRNKNLSNEINLIIKYYRPKCDICNSLCESDWYLQTPSYNNNNSVNSNKDQEDEDSNIIEITKDASTNFIFLICKTCFDSENFPQDLTKEGFETFNLELMINKANESN